MNYSFDLHLHSCLSPYGGEDMTPFNIASMCALAGYDIVALTDYNSCGNSAAFQAAAEATEEAVLNSLTMAHTVKGQDGKWYVSLADLLPELLRKERNDTI